MQHLFLVLSILNITTYYRRWEESALSTYSLSTSLQDTICAFPIEHEHGSTVMLMFSIWAWQRQLVGHHVKIGLHSGPEELSYVLMLYRL